MSTGENWNDLMDAVGQGYSITNQCIPNATYADYVNNNYEPIACGSYTPTYIFFSSYILLVSMIFLNLFIAIILNGYFQTTEREKQVINSNLLENYRDAWAVFDPDATGYIHIRQFEKLMI